MTPCILLTPFWIASRPLAFAKTEAVFLPSYRTSPHNHCHHRCAKRLAKQHLYPPPSLRAAKRRDNPENAVATGCDGNSVHPVSFTPDCSDMTAAPKQGY